MYLDFGDLCRIQRAVDNELRANILVNKSYKTKCKCYYKTLSDIEKYKRLSEYFYNLINGDDETDNNQSHEG